MLRSHWQIFEARISGDELVGFLMERMDLRDGEVKDR
jgi:hypothetical protein